MTYSVCQHLYPIPEDIYGLKKSGRKCLKKTKFFRFLIQDIFVAIEHNKKHTEK